MTPALPVLSDMATFCWATARVRACCERGEEKSVGVVFASSAVVGFTRRSNRGQMRWWMSVGCGSVPDFAQEVVQLNWLARVCRNPTAFEPTTGRRFEFSGTQRASRLYSGCCGLMEGVDPTQDEADPGVCLGNFVWPFCWRGVLLAVVCGGSGWTDGKIAEDLALPVLTRSASWPRRAFQRRRREGPVQAAFLVTARSTSFLEAQDQRICVAARTKGQQGMFLEPCHRRQGFFPGKKKKGFLARGTSSLEMVRGR